MSYESLRLVPTFVLRTDTPSLVAPKDHDFWALDSTSLLLFKTLRASSSRAEPLVSPWKDRAARISSSFPGGASFFGVIFPASTFAQPFFLSQPIPTFRAGSLISDKKTPSAPAISRSLLSGRPISAYRAPSSVRV